jgi:hypothetical protein
VAEFYRAVVPLHARWAEYQVNQREAPR